ncbi:CLUMA_CG020993, isoform A [Clunio marinus]|uniref:CLUMA_CG020993, isoform A n=1 Tax=Clunio marinus TaxID=568069 RepID=A0A1J1J6M3_9DIPT|nr:CLUMA_CG020993, isoform A [Clunio marinus]
MKKSTSKWCFYVFKATVLLLILGGSIFAIVYATLNSSSSESSQGAIAANGIECAAIGKEIYKAGGNVADVAVATVLCEGITCPQSSGLGGGFLLTIYIKETGTVETLNAREVAPKLATPDMFVNDSSASVRGGKAVAVPGELKGLWELHQKYGKLPWAELVQPSIKLARDGHVVSPYLQNIFSRNENSIRNEPTLKEIYINPLTNRSYALNEYIKRPKLAETLEIIAREGADAIYGRGSLAIGLINDIRERGGIITDEDLLDYQVRWRYPVSTTLNDNSTFHTFPLPSNGAITPFILNLLKDYDLKHDSLSYHRIVEAFKFAYAKRSLLGDEPTDEIKELMRNLTDIQYAEEIRELINDEKTSDDFEYYGARYENQEDHGTAHISILMPNGDAVAVTSTINYLFGAFFVSESTGIIMNNEMDDFSTPGFVNIYGIPASPANFIQPGKNPLSSMMPSILLDENGNPKQINNWWSCARRLHHQLAPMHVQFDTDFDQDIVRDLNEKYGHQIVENPPDGGFAAVVGIAKNDGVVEGVVDPRRAAGNKISVYECCECNNEGQSIRLIRVYSEPDKDEVFNGIAWSFDSSGPVLAAGGVKAIVRVIQCNGLPLLCYKNLIGHTGAVNDLKFHPKNLQLLLTCSKDYSIRLWNIKNSTCVAIWSGTRGHRDEVLSIDISADGHKFISGGIDHNIMVWNLNSEDVQEKIAKSNEVDIFGRDLLVAVRLHFPDFSTRDVHGNYVDSVKWFGDTFLTKSCENNIIWWKVSSSNKTLVVSKLFTFDIIECDIWFMRMELDLSMKLLAVGSQTGKVFVFDLDTEVPVNKRSTLVHLKCNSAVRQTSFSRDGRILIAACDDGSIWRWDKKENSKF